MVATSLQVMKRLPRSLPRHRDRDRCRARLRNLVGRDFSEDEARQHWEAIVEARGHLSRALGREVSLGLAAFDYFTSGAHDMTLDLRIMDGEALDRIQGLARTDALTGTLNRRGFEPLVEREAARARRSGRPLSMLVIDVDHFKSINDEYGHLWGDYALKRLAQRLASVCRASDAVARLGGDEFVMLLPETDLAAARAVAERARASVAQHDLLRGHPSRADGARVTVSIGVASGELDGRALLASADEALYEAKRKGRARVADVSVRLDPRKSG